MKKMMTQLSVRLYALFSSKKGKARYAVLAFLLFLSWSLPLGSAALPSQGNLPKVQPLNLPEEHFSYRASWSGIPVAKAKIDMRPFWQENKKFYQVDIQARSLKYLDLLFKVRDSITSIFEANSLRPHRFVFRQQENRKESLTEALYMPKSNHWLVQLEEEQELRQYKVASEDTLDPVAAYYRLRSLNWTVGDHLQLNVFVGGEKRYPLSLKIVTKERISTKAGDFGAYRIVSRLTYLKKSGDPKEVREAVVWISADESKVLLKVSSRVWIGELTIELVDSSVNLKS